MLLLELETRTPLTHGDPGARREGNTAAFRTLPGLYRPPGPPAPEGDRDTYSQATRELAAAAIDELAADYPLPPGTLGTAIQAQSGEDFVAILWLTRLIGALNPLNGGDGTGLFRGPERYDQLLTRLAIVGAQAPENLLLATGQLLIALLVDQLPGELSVDILRLAALPLPVQQVALARLGRTAPALLAAARAWRDASKPTAGRTPPAGECYQTQGRVRAISLDAVQVAPPWVSPNSLRHALRAVLGDHLLAACQLPVGAALGQAATLAPGLVQLLTNGGNLAAKATAAAHQESISATIFATFPHWAALGGVLHESHILGRSALNLAAWVLCRENNAATADLGASSDLYGSDLLTTVTHATHATSGLDRAPDGKSDAMLVSHTVLKPGARLLLAVTWEPHAAPLTRGAGYFGLAQWLDVEQGQIGGKGAQGEGWLREIRRWWRTPAGPLDNADSLAADYDAYITSHAPALRAHLVNGTLGWRERVI